MTNVAAPASFVWIYFHLCTSCNLTQPKLATRRKKFIRKSDSWANSGFPIPYLFTLFVYILWSLHLLIPLNLCDEYIQNWKGKRQKNVNGNVYKYAGIMKGWFLWWCFNKQLSIRQHVFYYYFEEKTCFKTPPPSSPSCYNWKTFQIKFYSNVTIKIQ